MDSVPSNETDVDISGKEFYLALQVLRGARPAMEASRFSVALKLIWKRCFLRDKDEWELINKTAGNSDHLIQMQIRDTTLCQTMALGLQDGKPDIAAMYLLPG